MNNKIQKVLARTVQCWGNLCTLVAKANLKKQPAKNAKGTSSFNIQGISPPCCFKKECRKQPEKKAPSSKTPQLNTGVYYEIQNYVGRKIDTLEVSQKWMRSKWTKTSLSVLRTILEHWFFRIWHFKNSQIFQYGWKTEYVGRKG